MEAARERRAATRAPLGGAAVVLLGRERLPAESIDISQSGIALRMPRCPEPGTFLRICFSLEGGARLDADGVVARIEPHADNCAVGVQFEVVEGHVIEAIHHYVSHYVSQHDQQRAANEAVRRRTGEYAPVERYPPPPDETIEAARGTPGMPDGPAAAPSTGEYLPPREEGDRAYEIPVPPPFGVTKRKH